MAKVCSTRSRTLHLAMIAALAPAAALAAPPPPGDTAGWVSRNTDLLASHVALIDAENVYALEPLGERSANGEVIALVRTEAFASDWSAAHGFQSWDANLLIDCRGRRLRVIRSASYPERNRQGRPVAGAPDAEWSTPATGEPGARLVAAACDPAFSWPLRGSLAAKALGAASPLAKAAAAPAPVSRTHPEAPPAPLPQVVEIPPPVVAKADTKPDAGAPPPASMQQVVEIAPNGSAAAAPTPAGSPAPADGGNYAVQLARGPSEEGANKALAKARAALGAGAAQLTGAVQASEISRHRHRYTASLSGFPNAAAAEAACAALTTAGQDCLTAGATPVAAAAPARAGTKAAAAYFLQLTRGPSEDGARKALEKARVTLGPAAEGLTIRLDMADISGRKRYTARLEGLPSAQAAETACGKLSAAGQSCFFRPMER